MIHYVNSGTNSSVTSTTALHTAIPISLSISAVSDTKTYDSTTSSAGLPTTSGLQGSDTVTGLSQAFDSANAGSRTLPVNGGYVIHDGNGGANYSVTPHTASGTINPAPL